MSRLYKRFGNWWGYWRDADGRPHRESLRTQDRGIARDRLRDREASPDRPAHSPTLAAALTHLLDVVYAGRPAGTLNCYRTKARHLERILGELTPISDIDRAAALKYRAARLGEGAGEGTVYKELVVLRLALRESGVEDVVPRLSAEYVPRTTHLSLEHFEAVVAALPEHRRLFLLVAVFVGGRRSELEGLLWEDVDLRRGLIHVEGTKTKKSDRWVPIADELRPLLEVGGIGPVLHPWGNVTRDINAACKRVGAPRCSCNDLRRTFASWLKQRGVDSLAVAKLMGSSVRMVEGVYGQLDEATLRAAIAQLPRTVYVHKIRGSMTPEKAGNGEPRGGGRAKRVAGSGK